jgi:hypothetical protein
MTTLILLVAGFVGDDIDRARAALALAAARQVVVSQHVVPTPAPVIIVPATCGPMGCPRR